MSEFSNLREFSPGGREFNFVRGELEATIINHKNNEEKLLHWTIK